MPDNADELAALNVKVNALERLYLLYPAPVGTDQPFGLYRRLNVAG
jgi:hypothetical protein